MSATEVVRAGDGFVDAAVALIVERARVAQSDDGVFSMSLCGGSTPRVIYEALVGLEAGVIDWARVRITFGDERSVPPDSDESNYRMAREALLDHVPIPSENVLRIEAEDGAKVAAERCDATMRKWAEGDGDEVFVHDLVLLGMGDDGHTASLFPGTVALEEERRWVMENYVEKFDTHRITLTYPVINAARCVCFLVTGEEKKGPVVARILEGGAGDPAAAVKPAGELIWLLGW
ncbi:MAG: 6-phosphogluconolactonase [Verrucomicrobiales bacterium]|jgi:6-phosphogluconolactonase